MEDCNCLRVGIGAKGTIPDKVSQLENDLEFVTKKQLEKVIIEGGGYFEGLENDTAKVIVDNVDRTIEVEVKPQTFEGVESPTAVVTVDNEARTISVKAEELKSYLPKDGTGKFMPGTYSLRATVTSEGIPTFDWIPEVVTLSPYYYGVTDKAISLFTDADLKRLTPDGTTKGDRTLDFSQVKQRTVFGYPASFGSLTAIMLKGVIEINAISSFEKVTLTVDGVIYYVYMSYNTSTGNYRYEFKY